MAKSSEGVINVTIDEVSDDNFRIIQSDFRIVNMSSGYTKWIVSMSELYDENNEVIAILINQTWYTSDNTPKYIEAGMYLLMYIEGELNNLDYVMTIGDYYSVQCPIF